MLSRRTVFRTMVLSVVGASVAGAVAACTRRADDVDVAPSIMPWSVSPSHGSSWDPSGWAGAVASIGVQNARGFRRDSDGYETIRAAGLVSTGILLWSPESGEQRFPIEDMEGWRAYVEEMVTSYPDVHHWEVWNEPPNFTADSSPVSYARIVVAAFQTVREVAPSVQIGLAAKSTHVAWLRETLLAGAAGSYDYITLHPYERAEAIADGWEEPFLAIVPQLRTMLRTTDLARVDVPVQFTEVGAPAAQHPGKENARSTPEEQARTLVKVMTMSAAQGVQLVSWYDPFDGDFDAGEAAFGLISRQGEERISFAAYERLIAALGESPSFVGLIQPNSRSFVFVFRCPDGRAAAIGWAQIGNVATSFKTSVSVTHTITGETKNAQEVQLEVNPVIVHAEAEAAENLLEAAREAQSQRTSSMENFVGWDAEAGAAGLYLRGLGDPVTIDGEVACAPTGAVVQIALGANVDLNSSYVRVTARVRGVRDTPGFNLNYDVDAPLSTLDWAGQALADGGWRHIAVGQWQTITWTMSDVRFAGLYGFNFRLDSDTEAYSGYQIASLTVALHS